MRHIKKFFFSTVMLLWGLFACAQSVDMINTVNGFNAGGGTENNISVSLGEPFFSQLMGADGYEVSLGVAQAQIVYDTIVADTCYGEPYVKYGFSFADDTPVGTYDSSRYVDQMAQYNYDSVFTLILNVNPTYMITDTLVTTENPLPNGLVEGDNFYDGTTSKGCDSISNIYVIHCLPVTDVDHNTYNAVVVSGRCWTKENLRTEHYESTGEAIPGRMVYKSADYPNETENLNTYGSLYTWYSTVGVPERSTDVPTPDASGFVQGICPSGWHVPTVADMEALMENPAVTLRSSELWLQNPGSNTTGFTALPAGEFNPDAGRFENLRTYTGFWAATPVSTPSTATSYFGKLDCWCGDYRIDSATGNYALSVRCVKH